MPRISMTVNGEAQAAEADTRTLLVEFLREQLGLTGTHVGCDTTQCGACMVILNGDMVKSCTVFAVQAEGAELRTIEGVADGETLHPVQEAFHVHHGLQCGFCTPGMVMTALALLEANPRPGEAEVRAWFRGNLCRCTGYHNIVKAVLAAAEEMAR